MAAHLPDELFGATQDAPWPESQALLPAGHPSILISHFTDSGRYHPGLIARILELERDGAVARRYVGAGGVKLHHLGRWNSPEAALIDARARALYRRVLGRAEAVVDLSWCNVYRDGDYCMPHAHERAEASIVYCVDPGDDPRTPDPLSGCFYIADPRIDACCRPTRDYMTSPIFPDLRAGSMLIFPAQVIHAVNPYRGTRPRITLSWNISDKAIAGEPLPPD